MSRKTEEDYVAVLQALVNSLEETSVEEFMVDYEVGAWLAIHRVFPTVAIKGCIFHWTQAVWWHVQSLGLAREGTTGSPQLHPSATLPAFPARTTHSRDIPPSERKSQHTTTSRPGELHGPTVVSPLSLQGPGLVSVSADSAHQQRC